MLCQIMKKTIINATVMDTANASWENKPLKETEGLLDDASPVLGCYRLAADIQTKKVVVAAEQT